MGTQQGAVQGRCKLRLQCRSGLPRAPQAPWRQDERAFARTRAHRRGFKWCRRVRPKAYPAVTLLGEREAARPVLYRLGLQPVLRVPGVADLSEAPGAAGPTMRVVSHQRADPVGLGSCRAALCLSVAGASMDEAGHGCVDSPPRLAAHGHCQPLLSAGRCAARQKSSELNLTQLCARPSSSSITRKQ